MSENENRAERLEFMVTQLASDLEELVDALKSGAVPYDVAVAGMRTQLTWALENLPDDVRKGATPANDQ